MRKRPAPRRALSLVDRSNFLRPLDLGTRQASGLKVFQNGVRVEFLSLFVLNVPDRIEAEAQKPAILRIENQADFFRIGRVVCQFREQCRAGLARETAAGGNL